MIDKLKALAQKWRMLHLKNTTGTIKNKDSAEVCPVCLSKNTSITEQGLCEKCGNVIM